MTDTLMIVGVFVAMVVSIWLSYKFFMRGNTDAEKVAALLPQGYKPDWHYRGGDTYVGFESASGRLALVDWPHARVVAPRDIVSVERVDQSIAGLKHRWVVLAVGDPKVPQYRLWFQFKAHARDEWLAKLQALKAAGG